MADTDPLLQPAISWFSHLDDDNGSRRRRVRERIHLAVMAAMEDIGTRLDAGEFFADAWDRAVVAQYRLSSRCHHDHPEYFIPAGAILEDDPS